jgi:hypothetical protein
MRRGHQTSSSVIVARRVVFSLLSLSLSLSFLSVMKIRRRQQRAEKEPHRLTVIRRGVVFDSVEPN